MHYQKNILFDIEPKIKGVKVTRNVAQYPPHHMSYAAEKFDVAASHGLWEDAFTVKYIIWLWHWGQGHTVKSPNDSFFLLTVSFFYLNWKLE